MSGNLVWHIDLSNMITAKFTPLEAAINRVKASGGEVGNPEFLAEMDKAGVINLSRNIFEVGDTFTIPATRGDVVPFLVKDILTKFPKSRITGQHPVDYSILVEVKNAKTGIHIKRFRVNDPCNSFKEYRREGDTYIPTGKIIGSQNELAEKLRPLNNQGARLDYLLGKTLRVETLLFGYEPFFTCGKITSIGGRWLSEFIVLTDNKICSNNLTNIEDNTVLSEEENIFEEVSDKSITDITVPDGVTTIGYGAFEECSSLRSVNLPDSLKAIDHGAFYECKALQNISFPNELSYIGESAFEGCSSLVSIILPERVEIIREGAFSGCESLKNIVISSGNINIGGGAFAGCHSLEKIDIPYGLTYINTWVFKNCRSLKYVDIPNSVTHIDGGAFAGCRGLQSIDIPNSVNTIGELAFCECSSLKHLHIPNSVTKIGKAAFGGCSSFQSIDIPCGITEISDKLFMECLSLQHINLPDNLVKIGNDAFQFCSSLKSVEIPINVKSIGSNAFERSGIEKIYIPKSVNRIGWNAFKSTQIENFSVSEENMNYLSRNGILLGKLNVSGTKKEIIKYPPLKKQEQYTIESDVYKIEDFAFERNNIKKLHCRLEDPNLIELSINAFNNHLFEECILYIPSGTRWAYRHHPVFGKFKNIEIE